LLFPYEQQCAIAVDRFESAAQAGGSAASSAIKTTPVTALWQRLGYRAGLGLQRGVFAGRIGEHVTQRHLPA
jgi:hypothetical protein